MTTTPSRLNFGAVLLFLLCIAGWACAFLLFTRNPVVSSVTGTLAPKSALSLSENRFATTDGYYVTLWQVSGDNKLTRLDTQLQVEWSRRMEDTRNTMSGTGTTPTPPVPSTPVSEQ